VLYFPRKNAGIFAKVSFKRAKGTAARSPSILPQAFLWRFYVGSDFCHFCVFRLLPFLVFRLLPLLPFSFIVFRIYRPTELLYCLLEIRFNFKLADKEPLYEIFNSHMF